MTSSYGDKGKALDTEAQLDNCKTEEGWLDRVSEKNLGILVDGQLPIGQQVGDSLEGAR